MLPRDGGRESSEVFHTVQLIQSADLGKDLSEQVGEIRRVLRMTEAVFQLQWVLRTLEGQPDAEGAFLELMPCSAN